MGVLGGNLLAWGMALLGIGWGLLGVVYGLSVQTTTSTLLPQSLTSYVAGAAVAIAYSAIGLTIKLRRVGAVIGWLFIAIGLVAGFSNVTWAYVALSFSRGASIGPLPMAEVAWISNAALPSAWFILIAALGLLFPDGRLVARRWRIVLAAMVVVGALLVVSSALAPGVLPFYPFATNPHGVVGTLGDAALASEFVLLGVLTLFAVGSLWGVAARYRLADAVERQQLKWFAWAVSLVVVTGTVEIVVAGPWSTFSPTATDLAWIVFALAAILVPVSALIAMMRYRLYEIDRLISRTFVYGALTALLAGLYTASIKLFTSLFVGVTGQSSDGALVLTTLVLATSFTPLKGRLERIAGERFKPAAAPGAARDIASIPIVPDGRADIPDELERRIEEIARRAARETVESELARGESTARRRRVRPRRPTSAS
jgi:hypothetical protein